MKKHWNFNAEVGEKEIILRFQKRRFGPLRNGKEPIYVILFFSECVSDWAVRIV